MNSLIKFISLILFVFIVVSESKSVFSRNRTRHIDTNSFPYNYEEKYYSQRIDHFNYVRQDTFKQRYWISTDHWCDGCPIFFYLGNEADLELYANQTGFLWENAEQFQAMIIFAEHRYYGNSSPFENVEGNLTKMGYLTSEQALADFSHLIAYIKNTTPGAKDSPIVLFGGSYAGMLAVWHRIKYPWLSVGALASSAPILDFTYRETNNCGDNYYSPNSMARENNSPYHTDFLYLWTYQTCTELVGNDCSRTTPFNFTEYSDHCYKWIGIRPEEKKTLVEFGGKHVESATNVIFSNGMKDFWNAGGIHKPLSPTQTVIVMKETDHCTDLLFSTPDDPQELTDCRKKEILLIKQWISDYYNNKII